MKCRIWRKLHAEEARNFATVYDLLEKHPSLSLADGFGMLQSGLSYEDFQMRRARMQRKAVVKQARHAIDNSPVAAWFELQLTTEAPLCVVLAERTVMDTLVAEEPTALQLARAGRVEKLQVVALARASVWEPLLPTLKRDPRLAQRPVPVARQPDQRPFSDPRGFLERVGQTLRLQLRNGLALEAPLLAVGGFDLVLGDEAAEVLVPLHALLRWEAIEPSEAHAAEGSADADPTDPDRIP